MGKDSDHRKENTEVFEVQPTTAFIIVAQDSPPSKSGSGKLVIYSGAVDEPLQKGTVVAKGPDCKVLEVGDRVLFQNDVQGLATPIEFKSRELIGVRGPIKFIMKEINVLAKLNFDVPAGADPDGVNNICIGLKPDEVKKRRDADVEKMDKEREQNRPDRRVIPGRVVGAGPWNK